MKIVPEPMAFEWDKGNFDKNLKKHKVTNRESEEVFKNDPLIILEDVGHSVKEKRFSALGKTNESRLLFLSFTLRKDRIRVISVRDMSQKEEVKYEKA